MTDRYCSYNYPDGTGRCPHVKKINDKCIFHAKKTNTRAFKLFYFHLLRLLVKEKNGDLRGFSFPNINVDSSAREDKRKPKLRITPDLDLRWAQFAEIKIVKSSFDGKITGRNLTFDNLSINSSTFLSNVELSNCLFKKEARISSVFQESLNLSHSTFNERLTMYGQISKTADFSNCQFESFATFQQTKTVTFQGKSREELSIKEWWKRIVKSWTPFNSATEFHLLFNGRLKFNNVILKSPKDVIFNGVDLRRAQFSGTDLTGVNLIGNKWYQKKLKIIEDSEFHNGRSYQSKQEALPHIENTYRNIRNSLEATKDFHLANDFFVGEMTAKRRQLPIYSRLLFSFNAIYRYFSNYGTSPFSVLLWICLLITLHSKALFSIYTSEMKLDFSEALHKFGEVVIYSVQTVTLQKEKIELLTLHPDLTVYLMNSSVALLGPILLAMLGLTIRTKIRRN